ncbi:MAG: hypothetical protein MUF49_10750 [Oculatellaceae cyanobacterium Prado106]|nr:hypothetical protein [Oculatellaceae cyanobacterium Prado106]
MSLFFALAVLLFMSFSNRSLANRGKVYVQMRDGTTNVAQEYDDQYRDSKIIQNTIVTWMQLAFEWDNKIPGSQQTDTGMEILRAQVPTKVYLAGYLLEDGFRQEFLKQMGESIIPRDVFSGNRRSVLRFYSIGNPRQIAVGRWQVDVVATRIESGPTKTLREVPINRTITVQAIPPVPPALGENEPLVWRQKIYELLQNGLMITDVVPLEPGK